MTLTTPNFQRTIEDFSCQNCGQMVSGNGYTNHCPSCLWSKHVDIMPGDRSSECNGMMEPKAIEKGSRDENYIVHVCKQCGFTRRAKVREEDSLEAVVEIIKGASN